MRAETAAQKRMGPTPQELNVLVAVVEHGGIKLAARQLDLSAHTVRTYLDRLRDKSGRTTLAQLLLWAHVERVPVVSKSSEPPLLVRQEVVMEPVISAWKGLSDAQWAQISPQMPAARSGPGRQRSDRRAVLNGILYKLRTGCIWEQIPAEFGNRSTCSRCYRDWVEDGSWQVIWKQFYATLNPSERREWGWLLLESGCVPELPER